MMNDELLRVRRHVMDVSVGVIRVADFREPHLVLGSPRLVAGFVKCNRFVGGGVAHSCKHGAGPHSIRVVASAADNDRETFRPLLARASREPPMNWRGGWVGAQCRAELENA